MREKRVWRYYCEYCRKTSCGKHAMAIHEAHCTKNPNRECRMCKTADLDQKPMIRLISAAHNLTALRDDAEGCPACILAAFRQAGLHPREFDFDYQKECEAFWSDVNEAAAEREYRALL